MSSRHHEQPRTSITARTARVGDIDFEALEGPVYAPVVHGADPEVDAAMLVIDERLVERLARYQGEVRGGQRTAARAMTAAGKRSRW